jgi:hypothetical protein
VGLSPCMNPAGLLTQEVRTQWSWGQEEGTELQHPTCFIMSCYLDPVPKTKVLWKGTGKVDPENQVRPPDLC